MVVLAQKEQGLGHIHTLLHSLPLISLLCNNHCSSVFLCSMILIIHLPEILGEVKYSVRNSERPSWSPCKNTSPHRASATVSVVVVLAREAMLFLQSVSLVHSMVHALHALPPGTEPAVIAATLWALGAVDKLHSNAKR